MKYSISPTFLTSALDGSEWQASSPGRFFPRGTTKESHFIGGYMDPRASMDTVKKNLLSLPHSEIRFLGRRACSQSTELKQKTERIIKWNYWTNSLNKFIQKTWKCCGACSTQLGYEKWVLRLKWEDFGKKLQDFIQKSRLQQCGSDQGLVKGKVMCIRSLNFESHERQNILTSWATISFPLGTL